MSGEDLEYMAPEISEDAMALCNEIRTLSFKIAALTMTADKIGKVLDRILAEAINEK